jgi:hypothetical protein
MGYDYEQPPSLISGAAGQHGQGMKALGEARPVYE